MPAEISLETTGSASTGVASEAATAAARPLYDAFISWSHAKDKALAAALQSTMQRLGKTWHQRRALRLFWPRLRRALPALALAVFCADCSQTSPEAALSIELGNLRSQGRFDEARRRAEEVLAGAEREHGPDAPEVAAALVEVARVDDSQGRYADAEQGYKHALAIDEKVTPDNIKLALILNDLGNLYVSEGRFSAATGRGARSSSRSAL